MPYEKPTVDQFTTRFPIFSEADEDLITALIDEAASRIDNSWREVDYQPAILYLTAHLLATDNSGEDESVEFGAAGGNSVASESFGPISVSYGRRASTMNPGASLYDYYQQTEYGRRFYRLLKLNKPAVLAV